MTSAFYSGPCSYPTQQASLILLALKSLHCLTSETGLKAISEPAALPRIPLTAFTALEGSQRHFVSSSHTGFPHYHCFFPAPYKFFLIAFLQNYSGHLLSLQ